MIASNARYWVVFCLLLCAVGLTGCDAGWVYRGGLESHAKSIAATQDGGFVWTGWNLDEDIIIRTRILRADGNGKKLWERVIEEQSFTITMGREVRQTDDGGYIVVAAASGPLRTLKAEGESQDAILLVRLNPNGETVWQRTYSGTSGATAFGVIETSDGFLVAGCMGPDLTYTTGPLYLLKVNTNGDKSWDVVHQSLTLSELLSGSINKTQDGGGVLAVTAFPDESGASKSSGVTLLKVSGTGDIAWQKTFMGLGRAHAFDVLQKRDGGFAFLGYTLSAGTADEKAYYLVRTDENGNSVWEKTFSGYGAYPLGAGLVENPDGSLVVGGTGLAAYESHMYIAKFSSSGQLLWEKTPGSDALWPLAAAGIDLSVRSGGGYLLAGERFPVDFTGTGGDGYVPSHAYVMPLDANGNRQWW